MAETLFGQRPCLARPCSARDSFRPVLFGQTLFGQSLFGQTLFGRRLCSASPVRPASDRLEPVRPIPVRPIPIASFEELDNVSSQHVCVKNKKGPGSWAQAQGPGPWPQHARRAPSYNQGGILQQEGPPTTEGKSYNKRSLLLQHKLPTWMC